MRKILTPSLLGVWLTVSLPNQIKAQAIDSLSSQRTGVTIPDSTVSVMPYAPEMSIPMSSVLKNYYVELPFNKTLSIIFPTAIRSVDLGSRDIIADKAMGVENVLKVKASVIGFNETNFSVITADGKFYSFVANYNESPVMLALDLSTEKVRSAQRIQYLNPGNVKDGVIQFAGVEASQSDIVYYCSQVLDRNRSVRHIGIEKNRMQATLMGLYVKENILYYRINMENRSNLNFDIDYVRFFIVDTPVAKLTSSQNIEINPLHIYNQDIKTVRGKAQIQQVYAFPRFTIPNNKRLLIMVGERNGGRNLAFHVENPDIMDASTF